MSKTAEAVKAREDAKRKPKPRRKPKEKPVELANGGTYQIVEPA